MIRKISVPPFKNLSSDKENEYLSSSISIEITHILSKYKDIRVVLTNFTADKTTSSTAKPEVDLLIHGTFLKIENRIRVTVQFISQNDNSCLFSAKFEEDISDIFELIDKISIQIVEILKLEIIDKEGRSEVNTSAYDYFLKGLHYWNLWNESNIRKAVSMFKKALETEPNYAICYARIANCYTMLAAIQNKNAAENYAAGKKAALKSLELDANLIESHLSLALIKLLNDVDILGAYHSLEKAFSINPDFPNTHYYYAFYLLVIGKYDLALLHIKIALEADPENVQINSTYGYALSLAGKYDLAEIQLKKTLRFSPESQPTLDALIWNYILEGTFDKAYQIIENIKTEIFLSPATEIILFKKMGLGQKVEEYLKRLENKLKKDNSQQYVREASIVYLFLDASEKGQLFYETFFRKKIGFIMTLSHPAWKDFRESSKFYKYKKRLALLHPPLLPQKLQEKVDDMLVIYSDTAEKLCILAKDFLYAESQGVYSKIVYKNEQKITEKLLRISLSKIIDNTLSPCLYRCHKSFIVNTQVPISVTGNRRSLKLKLPEISAALPVSRSKSAEVYQVLNIQ